MGAQRVKSYTTAEFRRPLALSPVLSQAALSTLTKKCITRFSRKGYDTTYFRILYLGPTHWQQALNRSFRLTCA